MLAAVSCPTAPEVEARLTGFDRADWGADLCIGSISAGSRSALVARLADLGLLERCLPESLRLRFQQDIEDNRVRTRALFAEAAAISRGMSRCGVRRLRFSLRNHAQRPIRFLIVRFVGGSTIDFLVAAGDTTAARHVLMTFGYALHAVCGNSMEFKAGQSSAPDIRKIYRVHSQRSLELHMLSTTAGRTGRRTDRLSRAQFREFDGVAIPTLAPADILVQQGDASVQAHLRRAHACFSGCWSFGVTCRHGVATRLSGLKWSVWRRWIPKRKSRWAPP